MNEEATCDVQLDARSIASDEESIVRTVCVGTEEENSTKWKRWREMYCICKTNCKIKLIIKHFLCYD